MNKVYISGELSDEPELVNKPDGDAHCVFGLLVKHHSRKGICKEVYRVNAWHRSADFCIARLSRGMRIAIQGYLTQRPLLMGKKVFFASEITINEVFLPLISSVQTKVQDFSESIDETQ